MMISRPLTHAFPTGAMVRLALVNALLNLVTLTLWRFWAKTRVRRALWGGTHAWGDPVEYTGAGRELFIGFLVVLLLVVAPLMVAATALEIAADEDSPLALLFLPLQGLVLFLVGAGLWRARRYQLSRTAWRGIRGGLGGAAWRYGLAWLGVLGLSILTLGWAWPWGEMRLARMRLNHTSFGDRRFVCRARAAKVYPRFALLWLAGAAIAGLAVAMPSPEIWAMAALAGLPLVGLAWAGWRAAHWREIARATRFGDAAFRFEPGLWAMARLAMGNALITILSLGLLRPWASLRTFRFACANLGVAGEVDFDSLHQSRAERPRTGEGLIAALDGAGEF